MCKEKKIKTATLKHSQKMNQEEPETKCELFAVTSHSDQTQTQFVTTKTISNSNEVLFGVCRYILLYSHKVINIDSINIINVHHISIYR